MSTPTPPAGVLDALASLRSAFGGIQVMHECSDDCPADCDLTDYSEAAYRRHDEQNFDAREEIHERAEDLVAALDEWLSSVGTEPGATR